MQVCRVGQGQGPGSSRRVVHTATRLCMGITQGPPDTCSPCCPCQVTPWEAWPSSASPPSTPVPTAIQAVGAPHPGPQALRPYCPPPCGPRLLAASSPPSPPQE